MLKTIISNNCAGGAILHDLGMEFMTPTINLQILPEDYIPFCKHFEYYMQFKVKEYKEISPWHDRILKRMFGGIPDMPLGLLDDILICFQHYPTFEEGARKWAERAERMEDIMTDEIGFLFHARGPEYTIPAERFMRLDLPHKLCLTEGFDVSGAVRFDGGGFDAVDGKLRITQVYDYRRWMDGQD